MYINMISGSKVALLALLLVISACDTQEPADSTPLGNFNIGSDLFLAHFDSKTDVDDIQSIAAVSTMLRDARLSGVRYHAVAGAYGTQGGLYIPANELFDAAFGRNWSDAHADFDRAVEEVSNLVTLTILDGGDVWIAEAGQSDFSAAVIKTVESRLPGDDAASRVHIVQHSEWNEGSTAPENLAYVRTNATYYKIPDGNATGNGSPGFATYSVVNWRAHVTDPTIVDIWELALQISHEFNGKENRYTNQFIASGGMDFSDVSETCWIFGFEYLENADAFFREFGS
ncbi:MAG: hypothetical protein KTR29_21970 [Rhodothermaceae bacterium]|nr:hypothetical protein [Rhodothermaceae bacterium]